MIRSQEFTLPPNGAVNIDALTGYLRYSNGSAGGASTRVRVRAERGGTEFVMLPGEWCRFTEPQGRFYISNADNTGTIVGTMIVGSGDYGSDRVAGSVEVIDGGRARTQAGAAYLGAVGQASSATTFPHVQLWNPSASRRVIVNAVTFGANVAGTIDVALTGNALANVSGLQPINKLLGGPASIAQHRQEEFTSQLGGATAMAVKVAANQSLVYTFAEPVVLSQNQGLLLRAGTLNVILNANFEFFEEGV